MCGSTPCLSVTQAAATGPLTGFWTLNDAMMQAFASCSGTPCLTVTLGTGGTVWSAAEGGTGFSSYAVGDVLYADTTTTLAKLADVAAGKYLRSGGISTAPVWSTTTLPNSATTGDVLYASASNVYSNLAGVATGQLLASGGVATAPAWSASPTLTTSLTVPTLYGSAASGGTLAIASTSHATKGIVSIGSTNFDGVNTRVGIGVTPQERLHVFNATGGTYPSFSANSLALIENSSDAWITFFTPNTQQQGLLFADPEAGANNWISYSHSTNDMQFRGNNAVKFTIMNSGLLAIGTGVTASFPALKRSTIDIQARVADDSAYANFDALAYKASGAAGITGTATLCNSGACVGTCTIIFTGGIRTGGTC